MLKTLRKVLFGGSRPRKERRRLPPPGPCPAMGASIVKRNVLMKVSEPVSPDFWGWLVLSGWREVRMSRNRRKYIVLPGSAFPKLARVPAHGRDALCQRMLESATRSG
jgi:hypothetical protein